MFAQGQKIYLRDNLLGTTHDLENAYQFTTEAGTITGRFEVTYAQPLDADAFVTTPDSSIISKKIIF